LLGYYFPSSETARRNPIENHWTTDWDAATIIQALEEFYPGRPEDRHLATSSRWQQVVVESRKKARIQPQDMEAARRDTINEWSSAEERIGPIPYLNNYVILKDLSRCFTSKDNPAGTSRSNIQFQRDLTTMIQGDREYSTSPTLSRLCEMVARIMYQWESMTAEVTYPAEPHQPPAGQRLRGLLTKHRPVQVAPARPQQRSARAAIGPITHAMFADSVSTQISTSQDLGLGARLRELSVCGTRRPTLHCLGRDMQSQGPPPDPRHRTVLRRLHHHLTLGKLATTKVFVGFVGL